MLWDCSSRLLVKQIDKSPHIRSAKKNIYQVMRSTQNLRQLKAIIRLCALKMLFILFINSYYHYFFSATHEVACLDNGLFQIPCEVLDNEHVAKYGSSLCVSNPDLRELCCRFCSEFRERNKLDEKN